MTIEDQIREDLATKSPESAEFRQAQADLRLICHVRATQFSSYRFYEAPH